MFCSGWKGTVQSKTMKSVPLLPADPQLGPGWRQTKQNQRWQHTNTRTYTTHSPSPVSWQFYFRELVMQKRWTAEQSHLKGKTLPKFRLQNLEIILTPEEWTGDSPFDPPRLPPFVFTPSSFSLLVSLHLFSFFQFIFLLVSSIPLLTFFFFDFSSLLLSPLFLPSATQSYWSKRPSLSIQLSLPPPSCR